VRPKRKWLLRLPEIRAAFGALRRTRCGSLRDRGCSLKRRRAIVLMHQFGGYQTGRTFLVDRLRLLGRLAAFEGGRRLSRREMPPRALAGLRTGVAGTSAGDPDHDPLADATARFNALRYSGARRAVSPLACLSIEFGQAGRTAPEVVRAAPRRSRVSSSNSKRLQSRAGAGLSRIGNERLQ